MPSLHETQTREKLRTRLQALQPQAARQWGQMSADQMLKHLNMALSLSLGKVTLPPVKMPMPGPLFRFVVVNLPWPKNSPTHPGLSVLGERCDFAGEKARCLTLLEEFARKPMESAWPDSPLFGRVTGKFNSRLQAKHVDHHLKQFSA